MKKDDFSAGTGTASTDIRFLKASRFRACWAGGRVSSGFWYLFDEDILVPSGGFKNDWGVRKERRDEGEGNDSPGRVSILVALNHHIGMTGQVKYPTNSALPRTG